MPSVILLILLCSLFHTADLHAGKLQKRFHQSHQEPEERVALPKDCPVPQPSTPKKSFELQPQKVFSSHQKAAPEHNKKQTPEPEVKPIWPRAATDNQEDKIDVNFDKTDLSNLLTWIEDVYNVKFITDSIVNPLPPEGKSVIGNQLTFKTHRPLTKRQVWDLFLTFLNLFDLSLVQLSVNPDEPEFYRVVSMNPKNPSNVYRSPVQSYIDIDWKNLPQNDAIVRYVYFIQNSTLANLQPLVESMRSTSSGLQVLPEMNAFILTDKASNIRSLMEIVSELDSVSSPEALSVLKLKHADAEEVVKLYETLTKSPEDKTLAARFLGPRKPQTNLYFPEMKLIAEPRTNALIILGTQEGIARVENFITNNIDTELSQPYSTLFVYDLQYANAEDMAAILNDVTKFAQQSPAAQFGGVRDQDKFLQPISFVSEPNGNRLIIRGEKDDYLKVKNIIQQLDVKQPQVAIEVLIVDITNTDARQLGVQIRNKRDNTITKNIDFQTSGISGGTNSGVIIEPDGGLMGNLVQLAAGQPAGVSLLSIGTEMTGGVWALVKALQNHTNVNIVAAPFLTAGNKFTAQVSVGEIRRVITGIVSAAAAQENTFGDVSAKIAVKVTPQINSDGIINLDIEVNVDDFTEAASANNPADRNTKTVRTNANLGNKEILAIGGLTRSEERETTTKVPVLGDIPLLGWIFKNKSKELRQDNLLVFICPRIIEPRFEGGVSAYTRNKMELLGETVAFGHPGYESRDPIHRWFFKDNPNEETKYLDAFVEGKNPPTRKPNDTVWPTPHEEDKVGVCLGYTRNRRAEEEAVLEAELANTPCAPKLTKQRPKKSITQFIGQEDD